MAFDSHKNLAYSTVVTPPSPAGSGTTLTVQTGEGARFPAANFPVTIWPAGAVPTPSNAEIAYCTARGGDTLTLVRASELGPARTIIVGDQVIAGMTVKTITDLETVAAPVVGFSGGGGPTLNDLNLGADADVYYLNYTGTITITGFVAGYNGQRVTLININVGQIDFPHRNAGSAAANQLILMATSGKTSLAPAPAAGAMGGVATFVYDTTNVGWRLVDHEQGGWITPAFSAANFTAVGAMTWTVAAGQVITCRYILRGRTVTFAFNLSGTTIGGTVNNALYINAPAWGGYSALAQVSNPLGFAQDGGGTVAAFARTNASTILQIFKSNIANWTATASATHEGQITFDVN